MCSLPLVGKEAGLAMGGGEVAAFWDFQVQETVCRGGLLDNPENGGSATTFPSLSYMARCRSSDCVAKQTIEANAACLPVDKPLQPPSGRAPQANCPHPFSALVVTETTLSQGLGWLQSRRTGDARRRGQPRTLSRPRLSWPNLTRPQQSMADAPRTVQFQ